MTSTLTNGDLNCPHNALQYSDSTDLPLAPDPWPFPPPRNFTILAWVLIWGKGSKRGQDLWAQRTDQRRVAGSHSPLSGFSSLTETEATGS